MAWWDAQPKALGASSPSRLRLGMGDVFPRLETSHADRHIDMERERALLSPVFEEHLGPPTTPALVVHVEIRFTDPVIRSRYCRSYGSSPTFDATNRICRGLVRRIERCSEELLTRKDSAALDMFKGDTYERKPRRFEMTFRIMRRGKGEWAERVYRSYQRHPLTVALTKDIILATHWMIGLFLRRHDADFQWLDCPVPEAASGECETMVPTRDGPLSLLCVPKSRFVEATQTFESLPGYSIELCFRSRNPSRHILVLERKLKINSTQTAALTLFMSEDMLWKSLQAIDKELDARKREFDDYLRQDSSSDGLHADDDVLQVDLRISNNLGPLYNHLHRSIRSQLALFRDPDARDCDDFLCSLGKFLEHIRDEADAKLDATDDFDFRVAELKGVGWSAKDAAKFTLGPSASYGRRTVQAALERIQTGIGDVIRGRNIAIHIKARKRGHLVLDKAIVAHEKRGKPSEMFTSHAEEQETLVERLKARIQKDLDKVFGDSCCIDDIPEDEEDYFARPTTPAQPELTLTQVDPSPAYSPSSIRSSPAKQSRATPGSLSSPRPRAQRVFSLFRRSTESVRSVDYLQAAQGPFANDGSRPGTATSEQTSERAHDGSGLLLAAADIRPAQRSFSLVSRRSSSSIVPEEQVADRGSIAIQDQVLDTGDQVYSAVIEGSSHEIMTSDEVGSTDSLTGSCPVGSTPIAANPADQQPTITSQPEEEENLRTNQALPVCNSQAGKMDTPQPFVDAREYAATPAPAELVQPEPSRALAGTRSPREDDEFSTAPSTPELSTGASSPRHSVLITPVFARTNSSTKDSLVQEFYSGLESKDGTNLNGGGIQEHTRDKDKGLADDEATANGPELESSVAIEVPNQPNQSAEAPDGSLVDADGQRAAGTPDPTVRVVSPGETVDFAQPTSTLLPTVSPVLVSDPIPDANAVPGGQASAGDVGAESTAGLDSPSPAPDFPTHEVRASGPNAGLEHAPVLHASRLEAVLSLVTNVPGAFPDDESHASGAAGSEFGAGCGAETTLSDGTLGNSDLNDASAASSGDNANEERHAESKTAPVGSQVASESKPGTERDTEYLLPNRGPETPDDRQVPTADAGAETEPEEHNAGHADADDGSVELPDGQNNDQSTADDAAADDVGSVQNAETVLDGGDTEAQAPETEEEHSAEANQPASAPELTKSPGSGAVPDRTTLDSGLTADDEPVAASEVAVEHVVGLDTEPEDVVHGLDGDADRVDKDAGLAADGCTTVAKTHATAAAGASETPPDGEEHDSEAVAAPVAGLFAETEVPEADEIADAEEGSATVPTVSHTISADKPEAETENPGEVTESFVAADSIKHDTDEEAYEATTSTEETKGAAAIDKAVGEAVDEESECGSDGDAENASEIERVVLSPEPAESPTSSPASPNEGADGEAPKPEPVVDRAIAQTMNAQADATGPQHGYEPGQKAEPRSGTVIDSEAKTLGSETEIDEAIENREEDAGAVEVEENVCLEPGSPEAQSPDVDVAPATPVLSFTLSIPDDSTVPPAAGEQGSPASGPATPARPESPTADVTPPRVSSPAAPSPRLPTEEPPHIAPIPEPSAAASSEKPRLAPIPDLSKLFPHTTTTPIGVNSASDDATSFTTRNSVDTLRSSLDTLRPSTDEPRPRSQLIPKPLSGGRSIFRRPRTATTTDYLSLGLCEFRAAEIGLRGALGARARAADGRGVTVARRRGMSLPLQRRVDPLMDGRTAVEEMNEKEKEKEKGGVDGRGEQSVVPRMVLLLAGAVAIGKMLKGVDG